MIVESCYISVNFVSMKNLFFYVLFVLSSLSSTAQNLKINRTIDIDTLHVWLDFSNKIDAKMASRINSNLNLAIERFNNKKKEFIIVKDTIASNTTIRLKMNSIKYISTKFSIVTTLYNIALIPGHYFMIKKNEWTLPLIPLFPAATSQLRFKASKDLFLNKEKQNYALLSASGYFVKKEKQKEKLIAKSGQSFWKFFKQINKQDKLKKERDRK